LGRQETERPDVSDKRFLSKFVLVGGGIRELL